ncbi:hypothetical protein E2562_039337 [Oryza meyeriana var. granulata]|uniref:Uncharacterized protein n=1 Tax=Oryza meyeriana var. granulata TaxID=110450 RepID=A0A6G1EUF9_9ORYZ|nr:hypothetical protein E2562_039337 [Oryza meyeriana var. granulata]
MANSSQGRWWHRDKEREVVSTVEPRLSGRSTTTLDGEERTLEREMKGRLGGEMAQEGGARLTSGGGFEGRLR